MGKLHYMTLGVDTGATTEEINKAYKKMAMQRHPDKHSSTSKEEQDKATLEMTKLNVARDTLVDPVRRAQYDSIYIRKCQPRGMNRRQRRRAKECFAGDFYGPEKESTTDSKDDPEKNESSTDGSDKNECSIDDHEKERSPGGPEKKERRTNDPKEKEEPKAPKMQEEHLEHITEELRRNHIIKSREVDQRVGWAYPKTKLRMTQQDSNSLRVQKCKSNRHYEGKPRNPLIPGVGTGRQDKKLLEEYKEKKRRKRGKCEKDPWAQGQSSKRQTLRYGVKQMGQIYEDYENYRDMDDDYSDYENDGDLDKDCNE